MIAASPVATLLTDFGHTDYYVAAVKGVLLARAPGCSLVDISHEVATGDIEGGAFLLNAASQWFASTTVHLAVVDPGVGSARRILVVEGPRGRFVGPDNGLLTPILEQANVLEQAKASSDNSSPEGSIVYAVERQDLFLPAPGSTFHGRDRFAPVAAFLLAGGAAKDLGPRVQNPVLLPTLPPRMGKGALEGRVLHIDRFGNLVTDLPSSWLKAGRPTQAWVGNHQASNFVSHYQEIPAGEAGILPGSLGTLELSLDGESLAAQWTVLRGAVVRIEGTWPEKKPPEDSL